MKSISVISRFQAYALIELATYNIMFCITATIAVAVVILLIAVLLRMIVLQLPRRDLATETSTTASLPTEMVKQYPFYTSTYSYVISIL